MAWEKQEVRRYKAAYMACASVYTDAEIAAVIGLTLAGLDQMKLTPEYKEILLNIKEGVIREVDLELGHDIKAMRARIKDNLPAAVSTIIHAATQRKDLKLAVSASETLIAMDGNFAPVKRVGVPLPEQGGAGIMTQEDADIASALGLAISSQPATIDSAPISEKEQ